MKRNRNRAAFMAAWISTGDMKLLIKTFPPCRGEEVAGVFCVFYSSLRP